MSGYINVPAPVAEKAAKDAKRRGAKLAHAAGLDDVAAQAKIRRATPDVIKAREHLGEQFYDAATDTVTVPLSGKGVTDAQQRQRVKKIRELHEQEVKLLTERGDHLQSRTPMMDIVGKDGQRRKIREANEEVVVRTIEALGQRIHAARSPLRGGTHRSLVWRSGIAWRVLKNGKMECLHRCCVGPTPPRRCRSPRCFVCHPPKKARRAA